MTSPAPIPDDVTLLLAVARRDEAAFAELYDRMARPIFSMVVRIVGSRAEAEDVSQDAFWQIWESAPRFKPELGSPFCWIVTIARRKAIDRLRANSRQLKRITEAQELQTEDEFTLPAVLDGLTSGERGATVKAALARLGPDERRAISLAFFDGLTYPEVSEALRVPIGTVKARIRRGLLKLKLSLAGLRLAGAN